MPRIEDIGAFNAVREAGLAKLLPPIPRIGVGMGTCGRGNGAEGLYHAFAEVIGRSGTNFYLTGVGCFGACYQEPLVNVHVPGQPLLMLHHVQANDARRIVHDVSTATITPDLVFCKIEEWDHITGSIRYGHGYPELPLWSDVPFFKGQKKIVLRNCGLINPDDVEEYIAVGGYQALYKTLIDEKPETVIEQVKAAKLRGRGGAGFLTGNKWEFLRKAVSDQKYVICNADEGDPGAYMNRNEIESDPHALLEGMIIGGYVMGATQGIIYVRAEYPLAVHRLNRSIEQAREYGLLGNNILGRGFNFDIEVVEGAGAFVCGEETALIASLEGEAGRPRPRPPFPAQKGLWARPSNINNVETWYNIAPIITKGPAWFTETGSAKSSGTKVFSLVGKVLNSGLVEMPMGTPIKNFIYDIGGGGGVEGRSIKAVQTGGPSGGCIPPEMFDTPVDYESLAQLGAIMGSGGMVVMDDDNCMVDVARYFVEFTNSESCGKCIPCRVGLNKCLRILNRVTEGAGRMDLLERLDELSLYIRDCSLCGLGQTAPNPVLTTMRHFRQEFEDHIVSHRCVAGVCTDLALSPCENSCPLHMNIPRFLQLYKEGQLEEAFESIIMDNPLPCSTGRVCQHPCDERCRRHTIDDAVNMREVHRFIADYILLSDKFDLAVAAVKSHQMESTGRKIAIAGAGPAGLTAAFYLALLGHDVTVYDSLAEAGGMLRYALPEYRLPKPALRREVELIERLGVKFVFNTRIGADITVNELEERYDSVLLAIGTWQETSVELPGAELKGVYPALSFLEAVDKNEEVELGPKVVVIGGGNAAIDSARTALRLGSSVTVVYRRERKDMPAIEEETAACEEEGAKIVFLSAPHRILGDAKGNVRALEVVKTRLGEYDRSGRRKPIATDEIKRFECDSVILAVGESVDAEFAKSSGLQIKDGGTIEVNHFTLETSRPRVFAGGDLVTGASNVSNAMAFGKQAAEAIDEQLMDSKRWQQLFRPMHFDQLPPKQPSESHRHHSRVLPPRDRATTFEEVVFALTAEQAHDECCRCLRCDAGVTVSR